MGEGEFIGEGEKRSASELLAGLRDPVELVVDAGGVPLRTVSGFQGKGTSRETLSFLQISEDLVGEEIQVKKGDGQVVAVLDSQPHLLEDGDQLVVKGKTFGVRHDPWANVMLSPAREEGEKKTINPESEATLRKVIDLWKSAIDGNEGLQGFLKDNFDEKTVAEMKEIIIYLKSHPALQKDLGEIDPWALSQLSTVEERVAFLRQEGVNYLSSFRDTEEFQQLMQISDKIARREPFSDEDSLFLKALAVSDIVSRQSVHDSSGIRITPFNERYALANLAENYLMRSLVPEGVFGQHLDHYRHFADVMRQQGVIVPEWFSSYRGEEFVYGPATDNTAANAGGKYFFSSFGEDRDSMAHILDHERMHQVSYHAYHLLHEGQIDLTRYEGFSSNEVYIEAFSLCVKYAGDIDAILASEDLRRTSYQEGCRRLFEILMEINKRSGDKQMGAKLLLEGVVGMAEGRVRGKLEPVEEYYDRIFEGLRFAERMAPFNDKRRLYSWDTPIESQDLSKESIIKALSSVSFEEIKKINSWYSQEFYEKRIDLYSKHPTMLLKGSLLNTDQLFYDRITADPQATAEMQALVDSYYQSYVEMIENKFEEDRQKGKTPVVAGGR